MELHFYLYTLNGGAHLGLIVISILLTQTNSRGASYYNSEQVILGLLAQNKQKRFTPTVGIRSGHAIAADHEYSK